MKKSNEQKPNIVHRLISSTIKLKNELLDNRAKSPVIKFNYELPKSFLQAVDQARVTSGYDILPRFRPRSASPVIHRRLSSSSSSSSHYSLNHQYETISKDFRSSSVNNIDRISTKKVPFRRKPRGNLSNQRQPITTPLLFRPRARFPMMMRPNIMMINRPQRPPNVLAMRSPIFMQPRQPIFRMRFR